MQRECASCGVLFEAKPANKRCCSARCNKRAQRGHLFSVDAPSSGDAGDGSGLSVAGSTRARLVEVARDASPLGQAALTLARRIDAGQDTGSGLAALTREWRSTLEAATAGAAAGANPVDQLQRRRQQRLG